LVKRRFNRRAKQALIRVHHLSAPPCFVT
jgi:hypothetical protein